MNYFDIVKPTYIENWEPALYSLSIASVDILLDGDAPRRLGTNIIEYGEAFCETDAESAHNKFAASWQARAARAKMMHQPEPPDRVDFVKPIVACSDISDIRAKVSEAVDKMPNGAFVRLGSRSPKDAWSLLREGAKVLPGTDPLRFMLDCSERIYEDLTLAIQQNYTPHIWVRQWVDIPKWSEFRCFMHNRQLVGISQYYYDEVFPELDADLCEWAIKEFFKLFISATTMDSVVFDVFVKSRQVGPNSRDIEVKLLEINPYFELTDPCLFAWNLAPDKDFHYKAVFDGSFKYNKAEIKTS